MSKDIATNKIGQEWLKADPDVIWDAEALPNATSKTSDEFMIGFDQAGVGLQVEADAAIVIADGETLLFELFYGSVKGASKTDSVVLASYAPSGSSANIAAGEIVAYVPEDIGPYAEVKVTASEDQHLKTVTVYPRYISR